MKLQSTAVAINEVHLLWFVKETPQQDVALLIGAYSSEGEARAAIERLSTLQGFLAFPDAFQIQVIQLNKDQWNDGFVFDEFAS